MGKFEYLEDEETGFAYKVKSSKDAIRKVKKNPKFTSRSDKVDNLSSKVDDEALEDEFRSLEQASDEDFARWHEDLNS